MRPFGFMYPSVSLILVLNHFLVFSNKSLQSEMFRLIAVLNQVEMFLVKSLKYTERDKNGKFASSFSLCHTFANSFNSHSKSTYDGASWLT